MYKRYYDLIKKFFFSLKYTGIKATYKKVDIFIKNIIAGKQLSKYSFDCFYQAKYIPSNTTNTDIKPIAFYSVAQTDIALLAARKPLYLNHYSPRIPLVYSNNASERINYHIKLAKEYQIYAFCYEVNDTNKYKNFISALNLCDKTHPFCLSLDTCLTADDINTVLNITDFSKMIKLDEKYIIILDIRRLNNYKDIDSFINSAFSIISHNIKDFQIWCRILHTADINHDKISRYIYSADTDKMPSISANSVSYINKKIQHYLYSYDFLAHFFCHHIIKSDKPFYKTIINGKDTLYKNELSVYKYSLEIFYNWIKTECSFLRDNFKENERFLFIDSFNNWDEYSHTAPEKKTGYAYLNTMYRAVFNKKIYGKKLSSYSQAMPEEMCSKAQICLQIHIFYLDLLENIVTEINKIPYAFDCYISTDSTDKAEYIRNYFKSHSNAVNVIVEIYDNKGRDVYPLIAQMSKYVTKYKFICHMHTKKSKIDIFGDNWREYLFGSLFGSKENIENILKNLEMNKGLGIVFPKPFQNLENAIHWGLNKELAENVLQKLDIDIKLPVNNIVFPVGNMFWARVDAVLPIFTNTLANNFPNEKGQADGTIAHAIERLWVYTAEYNGYTFSYCGEK
ncbi:rhamnan synthesis F family protein [Mucispirillum schaedleri]|uniref:rhamnan synthesis F family protein n=1 Tax=Mucispirillum schaedleri TaxID=248039 RepID=UPI001F5AE6B3|nr:rhamnan synthesis F family protein [Mucispirillum schaedleri]